MTEQIAGILSPDLSADDKLRETGAYMEFYLACAAGAIFAIWLLVYCAFAWLIQSTQKLSAEPPASDVAADMLPPEVDQFSQSIIESLAAIGFTRRGIVRMRDPAAQITNWVLLYSNAESNDLAIAAIVSSTQEGAEHIKASFVEFSTKLSDGRTVDTNNISTLLPYPASNTYVKTILPELNDCKKMYEVHQYVLKKRMKKASKLERATDNASKFIAGEVVGSHEQQVKRGLYYFDKEAAVFKPTWKGAFLMAFMLIWPITVFRRMLIKSNAQAVISACENSLRKA